MRAHLDVANVPWRYALTYVLEQAGHRRVFDAEKADVRVIDRHALEHGPASPLTTLVVDLVPAECQLALDAIGAGTVHSVICGDDPESLLQAVDAAASKLVVLPQRLVDAANRAPRLEPRLRQTLRLVLAGYSNPAIARQLHESESTAKRDITLLLRRFEVPNRVRLMSTARLAGFGP